MLAVVRRRLASTFIDRVHREPGAIEWVHIDGEPLRRNRHLCEIRLRDGQTWAFVVPAKLAAVLAQAVQHWPYQVSRSKQTYAEYLPWYEVEIKLRWLEDQLARSASSLAHHLAPTLLPVLGRRSSANMARDAPGKLKPALARLETLLRAASRYDASSGQRLRSDPPYADEAGDLARAVVALLEPHAPA